MDIIGWGLVISTFVWNVWIAKAVEKKFTLLSNLKNYFILLLRQSDEWYIKLASGVFLCGIIILWMLLPIIFGAFFIFVYHTRKESLTQKIATVVREVGKLIAIPFMMPLFLLFWFIIQAIFRIGILALFCAAILYVVAGLIAYMIKSTCKVVRKI